MNNKTAEDLAVETYNLGVAALFAAAALAGYPREEIHSFAFRDSFLSEEHFAANNKAQREGKNPPHGAAHYHNAARLNADYSVVQIPLTPRPVPPVDAKVSIGRKR